MVGVDLGLTGSGLVRVGGEGWVGGGNVVLLGGAFGKYPFCHISPNGPVWILSGRGTGSAVAGGLRLVGGLGH